jgi:hypothetical protein
MKWQWLGLCAGHVLQTVGSMQNINIIVTRSYFKTAA